MNSSLKRQLTKTFAQMIADLKDMKEAESFLTDFFDPEELEKYVKRLGAAYWLKKGRDSDNIQRNLNVTTKETDKARSILSKHGVKLGIKKIEAEEWANKWAEKIKAFSVTPRG